MTAEELSLWLENEVCQVVDELVDRVEFRAYAKWPIEQLRDGAVREERRLVEAVDDGLVQCASRLAEFAHRPSIWQQLLRLGPANERLADGDPNGRAPSGDDQDEPIPLGLRTIELIATRPWHDLVSIHDYFYPCRDLNLKDRAAYLGADTQHVQVGDFLPFCNPRLRLPGDFVSRTMLIRVDYWRMILQRFSVRCHTAWTGSGRDSAELWGAVEELRCDLRDNWERLRSVCSAGNEAQIRDSCIALLQVYAAYRPQADLTWLGLPPEIVRASHDIRHRVEARNDVSVTERIATALVDVADMYRHDIEPEAVIEEQCRQHALVLVMGPGLRRVYWRGGLIEQDWIKRTVPWDLLCMLAEHAKTDRGLDAMLWEAGGRGGSLKDRRHELKKLLPDDLNEKIRPVGRGTYKLTLAAHELCVLQYEDNERLVEVTPSLVPRR